MAVALRRGTNVVMWVNNGSDGDTFIAGKTTDWEELRIRLQVLHQNGAALGRVN